MWYFSLVLLRLFVIWCKICLYILSGTKGLHVFEFPSKVLPRERSQPPSAYLPFSERLMKNLTNPYKPFSPTLYVSALTKVQQEFQTPLQYNFKFMFFYHLKALIQRTIWSNIRISTLSVLFSTPSEMSPQHRWIFENFASTKMWFNAFQCPFKI